MEISATMGYVVPITLTLLGGEFFEHLMINKLPGEVTVHHSDRRVYNNKRNTRSITLTELRLIISRGHPLPGIVVYDHLMT